MNSFFRLTFTSQQIAKAIQVNYAAELSSALNTLGLLNNRPVMVIVGGASGISAEAMTQLRSIFTQVLAPLAQRLGACVIDGGTDAGIMQLMGQAHHEISATFPLIGVAAIGTVVLPNIRTTMADAAPLEPHHTHFVLVPGKAWGDESPWITRVADVLSHQTPSVTLLINGGQIAWLDVTNSVKAGRSVVILAGSGRTADTLTAMLRGKIPGDDTAGYLTGSGLLQAVDLYQGCDAIAHPLHHLLTSSP
jgi:hypothetical protein